MDDDVVADRGLALVDGHLAAISGRQGWLLALPQASVTTILCRSTGALLLLFIGVAVLALMKILRTRLVLCGLLLVVPVFVAVRISGIVAWEPVVEAAQLVGEERAMSLQGRSRTRMFY